MRALERFRQARAGLHRDPVRDARSVSTEALSSSAPEEVSDVQADTPEAIVTREALTKVVDEILTVVETYDARLVDDNEDTRAQKASFGFEIKRLKRLTPEERKRVLLTGLEDLMGQLDREGSEDDEVEIEENEINKILLDLLAAQGVLEEQVARTRAGEHVEDLEPSRRKGGVGTKTIYHVNKRVLSPVATAMNVATAAIDTAAGTAAAGVFVPAPVDVVLAGTVVGSQAYLKQGVKHWKDLMPTSRTGFMIAALVTAIAPIAGQNIINASLKAGVGRGIETRVSSAVDPAVQAIQTTKRELAAYPERVSSITEGIYSRAFSMGGEGHGPRASMIEQIFSGDTDANKAKFESYVREALQKRGIQGDALERQVQDRLKEFDALVARVTAVVRAFNETRSDGEKIPEGQGLRWLVKHEAEKAASVDTSTAEGKTKELKDVATRIGEADIYTELLAGFYTAGLEYGTLYSSRFDGVNGWFDVGNYPNLAEPFAEFAQDVIAGKASLVDLVSPLRHILLGHNTSISELRPQERAMIAEFEKLEQVLRTIDTTAEIDRFIKLLRESGVTTVTQKDAQNQTVNVDLFDGFELPGIEYSLTPEMIAKFGVNWGEFESIVDASMLDRLNALLFGIPEEWKPYIGASFEQTHVPFYGNLTLDKDKDMRTQILTYLGIALIILFYGPALARLGVSSIDRFARGRMEKNDDVHLRNVEEKIAQSLLVLAGERQRSLFERMLNLGMKPRPQISTDQAHQDALRDLLREHVVGTLAVPDEHREAVAQFVARKGPLPASMRDAYGETLDAVLDDIEDDTTNAVARGLLATIDQKGAHVEAQVDEQLRMLASYNNTTTTNENTPPGMEMARAGLVGAIKQQVDTLSADIRVRELNSHQESIAQLRGLSEFLMQELQRVDQETPGEVTPFRLLLEERLGHTLRTIEKHMNHFTALKREGDSVTISNTVSLDDTERAQVMGELQQRELDNTWRVVENSEGEVVSSSTNLAEAAREHSALWGSLLEANQNRLRAAYRRSAGPDVPIEAIAVTRAFSPTLGASTLAFRDTRPGGQVLLFNQGVPSEALTTTDAVITAVEAWFEDPRVQDMREFTSLYEARVRALGEEKAALGDAVDTSLPGQGIAFTRDADLGRVSAYIRNASIVHVQQRVLQAFQQGQQLSDLQKDLMRDPENSRFSGLFRGDIGGRLSDADAYDRFVFVPEKRAIRAEHTSGTPAEKEISLY